MLSVFPQLTATGESRKVQLVSRALGTGEAARMRGREVARRVSLARKLRGFPRPGDCTKLYGEPVRAWRGRLLWLAAWGLSKIASLELWQW